MLFSVLHIGRGADPEMENIWRVHEGGLSTIPQE